ncbi:MAG: ATP-binding domain-containing protein, partial [Lachnospiraceae bacterium]|nr:ATP-binding domain-containing protein [Lachnospiraceae bacterium]
RVFEEKLIYDNIPYKLYGGTNFYSRKEIRDVVSYLKLLVNSNDDTAVKRIINVPKRGIGDTTVGKINDFAIDNGINFYDALLDIEEVPGMSRSAEKIKKFVSLIESLKDMLDTEGTFISEVYDALLEKTGYVTELEAEGTDEARARIENVEELKNKIVKYEEEAEYPNLTELLEDISLVADVDEGDEDGEKVTLMTLHSAKGLEFPYVFIGGMEEGLFPSQMSIDSDYPDAVEEERRLCYVGITRAMDELYLSGAAQRMIRGNTNYSDISRFIREIPKDYIDADMGGADGFSKSYDKMGVGKQITNIGFGRPKTVQNDYGKNNPYSKTYSSSNPSANPGFGKAFPMGTAGGNLYAVGDEVRHIKFGKGVVTKVTPAGNDMEITVDFERAGEKRMFASLVKMKKL